MKLSYNNTDLATLGVLRVLGRTTRREPAEAPQRERVEYRVRLDFFQSSFQANFGLLQAFASALQSDSAALQWTDDGGTTYENRPVTAGDTDMPREALERGGTYWQAVEFSFWYWNHGLTLNTLHGSWTGSTGGALDLGAVENWSERTRVERVDPLRATRRMAQGTIAASGRWQADTTLPLAQRQVALQAQKTTLLAALISAAQGTLAYGQFSQTVRVAEFNADVNQPENFVAWTASFTFTRYPDEADYSLLDYALTTRFAETEGVTYLTLAGRIHAPTEAAARARLALLQTSVIPSGYALVSTQTDPKSAGSESELTGGNGNNGSDGVTFIDLGFTVEYRTTSGLGTTLALTGGATLNLGTVDRFRDALQIQRFSELRDTRRRVSGTVTLSGQWYAPDTLTQAQQQAALAAQWAALDGGIPQASTGTLAYGTIFNQTIRVVDFTADLDRVTNVVRWSLVATWTRYPNEGDYSLLDYTVAPRKNWAEGIQYLTVAGRIEAPTEAAARGRLAGLEASPGLVPSGYALVSVQSSARTVGSESNQNGGANGNNGNDGETFTELTFSVEYRDTSALPATYQNLTATGAMTFALGTVDKFKETTAVTRFDDLRDVRKRAAGLVVMAGKWYVSDTLLPADQQAQLTAQKQLFDTQLVNGNRGQLTYAGIFSQAIRVTEFTAEINRLTNCIEWTLAANYTRYPDEANYSLVELRVQQRLNRTEGINYLTLSGRIHAPSAAAAQAQLTAQAAAVVPTGYVTLATDISPATVGSLSDGTNGNNGGDGIVFTEITFTLEYRDITGMVCTYQRSAVNAPQVTLGTVDKFASRTLSTLFDELRSVRKRSAGGVTLSGRWWAADTLTVAAQQAQLLAQQALLQQEMAKGAAGQLNYGAAFGAVVRLQDFDAQINRVTNCIEWSLTASYTLYPNEADYAMADIQVGTRENLAEGTVVKTLTGRIGAQSATAALSKLARLRTAFIPAGYVLQSESNEQHQISTESGLATTGQNQGDGDAFIELTLNEVWQSAVGSVLEWSLRTSTDADVRLTTVKTTYSGTVRAAAATQPAAFAAAAVQASVLGGGKYPMLLRSNIVALDRLFQTTDGLIFVTVEFSYEYETATATSYLEVTSTRATDNYGTDTEMVTGMVAAPSLSAAAALYQTNVRGLSLFAGALILSERLPTLSQRQLVGAGALDEKYDFSLVLLRPKATGKDSITYDVSTQPDFRSLELTTTVAGKVWGASQVEAEAFLQSLLTGLAIPGKVVASPRTPHSRSGPDVGGSGAVTVFESMDFSVTYVSLFTGVAGILESEVTEEYVYSGNRNIEKAIPDGPSIVQQCGTTLGQHTVTARCRATTPTAAAAWVRSIRTALLLSVNGSTVTAYEEPPRISTGYKFLPQIAGVPVGNGTNVTVYEMSGTFSEKIPEMGFV